MKNAKTLLLVLGSVLLLLVVGTAGALPPRITWDPNPLDIKGTAPGEEMTYTVTLMNTGYLPILAADQLRIVADDAIDPYVTIKQPKFPNPFKSGQSVTFNVQVKAEPAQVTGALLLKRVIRNKVVAVWRAEALAVSVEIAEPIRWSQPSLEVDVLTGTIAVKSLSLYTGPEVDEVEYELMGDLGELATVASGVSDESSDIREHRLSLHFVVPDDTPVGDYEGTLYAWAGDRTLSRPLPILLRMVQPTAGSIPEGIAAIMPDRIVTDGETGFRYVNGQAEISLTENADISAFSERLQIIGGVFVGSVPGFPFYQIRFPDAVSSADLDFYIDQLRADPDVAGARREWLTEPRAEVPPNDAEYAGEDWGEDKGIYSNRNAHWVSARFPPTWNLLYAGQDINTLKKVQIGVVDYGFHYHQDLRKNVRVSDILSPDIHIDPYDHGTSVAGVIGAGANNNEGVAGGIWNVTLRVYESNSIYVETIGYIDTGYPSLTALKQIAGMAAAVNDGSKIVNLSQGTPYKNQKDFESTREDFRRFFGAEGAKEVLFVASAPKSPDVPPVTRFNMDTQYDMPSGLATELDNVVSVTGSSLLFGSDLNGHCYAGGGNVTVAAPSRVYTTAVEPVLDFPWKDFKYEFKEGTSYSAPMVSALAGLILTRNPNLAPKQVKNVIAVGACAGGRTVSNPLNGIDGIQGLPPIPVIDAYESVKLADTPDKTCAQVGPPPTVILSAVPNSVIVGESATLTWSSTDATYCAGEGFGDGLGGSEIVEVSPTGTMEVFPDQSQTYTLTCWGWGGSATDSATVEVTAAPPPPAPTTALIADPTTIASGQSATLTWTSTKATTCSGEGFDTGGAPQGSTSVTPPETTTYTVTCTGPGGTSEPPATATVTVTAAPPPSGTWSIEPASVLVGEGAGAVTFTVTRSDSTTAQTAYVSTVQDQGATNDGDYVGKLNETLDFAIGEDQQPVTVTINDDTEEEEDETFGLIVQQIPSDPIDTFLASATFTIVKDDYPAVPFVVFSDDFNRPDSQVVGNCWLESSYWGVGDLEILNGEITNRTPLSALDVGGVYRSAPFVAPIRIQATLKPGDGHISTTTPKYEFNIRILSNGVVYDGYGLMVQRSGGSVVHRFDNFERLEEIASPFQFGNSGLLLDATFSLDGSIRGTLTDLDTSRVFDFDFPQRAIQSDGEHFMISLEVNSRVSPTRYHRADDILVFYTEDPGVQLSFPPCIMESGDEGP